MPRDIFLYTSIYDRTSEMINRQLSSEPTDDVKLRINSGGGETNSGAAILYGLNAHEGNIHMSVEGEAGSYAAFMLLFSDYTEASDMATITFHKAAYPYWYTPTEAETESLNNLNALLKSKMEARLKNKGDKAMKLVENIFAEGERVDYEVSPKDALKYGIIDKIVKIDVKAAASLHNKAIAQMSAYVDMKQAPTPPKPANQTTVNNNTKKMDLNTLKSDHPAVYAQVLKEGETIGETKERDRVGSLLPYMKADEAKVTEMIKSGKVLNGTETTELNIKLMQSGVLENLGKENTPAVDTKDGDPNKDAGGQSDADKAEIEAYRKSQIS